jgi:hypothetical protein
MSILAFQSQNIGLDCARKQSPHGRVHLSFLMIKQKAFYFSLIMSCTLSLFACTTMEDVEEQETTENPSDEIDFVWYEDEFVKFQYPEGWEVEVNTWNEVKMYYGDLSGFKNDDFIVSIALISNGVKIFYIYNNQYVHAGDFYLQEFKYFPAKNQLSIKQDGASEKIFSLNQPLEIHLLHESGFSVVFLPDFVEKIFGDRSFMGYLNVEDIYSGTGTVTLLKNLGDNEMGLNLNCEHHSNTICAMAAEGFLRNFSDKQGKFNIFHLLTYATYEP